MTLCPYKWFLYIASAWAVLYLMLAAVPTSLTGDGDGVKNLDEYTSHQRHALAADSDDEDDY